MGMILRGGVGKEDRKQRKEERRGKEGSQREGAVNLRNFAKSQGNSFCI